MTASREYVCDACMRVVTPRDVAIWADHGHVICRPCDERERIRAWS